MYEVWVIRKENPDGSYSYYSHMANGFPVWLVGHDSRETAKHFLTEELMCNHTQAMIGTPDDKVKGSTVPETANQECYEVVQIGPELPFTVATQ